MLMLRDQLKAKLIEAMKAKEAREVSTLRLILAAIKNRDIAARVEDPTDADDDAIIFGILGKMIKQRNDSITIYEENGRLELAEQEKEEVVIIQQFLPRQMGDAEIEGACKNIILEIGAGGLKDIGRTMVALKSKYAGTMDFAKASKLVKELLS